ncbi:hypothetical protein M514_23108 [Trichuris suis]|uniref:Uncharacterized protein n=1 Tax=Trichuris suis TaxID=68888 RepID=A0A085N5A4_9BILA|nr:hypothetical protein M514_23108 [Trichuris suis]
MKAMTASRDPMARKRLRNAAIKDRAPHYASAICIPARVVIQCSCTSSTYFLHCYPSMTGIVASLLHYDARKRTHLPSAICRIA